MSDGTITRRRFGLGAGAAGVAACAPRERIGAPSYFEGRLSDWTQAILIDDPEMATLIGVSAADLSAPIHERLTDRGPEAMDRRRTAALRRLIELRALDSAAISPADQAVYAVAMRHFEAAAAVASFNIGAFSAFGGGRPYAFDQRNAAFIKTPELLDARQPLASIADAEIWLNRMAAYPAVLDSQIAHARREAEEGRSPPQGVAAAALRSAEALVATPPEQQSLYAGFARRLDALVPPSIDGVTLNPDQRQAASLKQQALALVRDRVGPALQRTILALRALEARAPVEPGVWRLEEGEAYYAAVLRYETSTALSPADLHALGRDRLAALTAEMDASLKRLGYTSGTVFERMAALTLDPAHRYPNTDEGRVQLLADVQARIDRALADAPNWFGALPGAGLMVKRTPLAAEAGAPGGYYEPPSLDGTQPGIYYINLRDAAERTRIDLPTQDYHQAVPGHHLQAGLALAQAGAPLLKRLMKFNAFAEGWALYAEQLAEERGYYSADPMGRLGYLRWQAWRAARLVADTGIHALRWSREQAIAYLAEATGDLRAVVEDEVDRYAAIPGHACSDEIGRREIVRLRDVARRSMGADFTLKAFHDQILAQGECPLDLLSEAVEAWARTAGGR
jgi:uncharacterized protein (DUF885 family)